MLGFKLNRSTHAMRVGDAIVWPFVSSHAPKGKGKGASTDGLSVRYVVDLPMRIPIATYPSEHAGAVRQALGLRPTAASMAYHDTAPPVVPIERPEHNRNHVVDFCHAEQEMVLIGQVLLTVCLKGERKPSVRVLVDTPRSVIVREIELAERLNTMGDAPRILRETRLMHGLMPSPLSVNALQPREVA